MINSYNDFVSSLVLDVKKGKEVSFLFGSAVSCTQDGKGVPGVSGMNELLKEYMIELDIYEKFKGEFEGVSETEKYQRSFEYLLKIGDQDDVKEIMSRAMRNVKHGDEWQITKTMQDFSNFLSKTNIKVKCILTTNFDPLIEEAVSKTGRDANVHNLIIDQPIGSVKSYSGDSIPVVHLHGIWDDDTMHTQTQLTTLRIKIERSIKDILDDSKLYVIGYAGWDDIFLQALKNIVNDFKPSYNIRWAFYSASVETIKNENNRLIEIVQPALANARFQGYSGVDCNCFFEDCLLELTKKKELINSVFESGKLLTKKNDNSLSVTTYNLSFEPAHDFIRFSEQGSAIESLNDNNCFELVAGWGYGKSGFIYSFLHDEFEDYVYFYTDINNLHSVEDITKKIKKDIGVDIAFFFADLSMDKRILIIDNIPKIPVETLSFFKELAALASDYNSNVKIIFVSNYNNGICKNLVNLLPLSVADVKEYIKVNTDIFEIKREELDRLCEITDGLPLKLDKVKEYNGLMSFKDILDAGKVILPEESFTSDIPHSLSKTINVLKSDNKKIYDLLCIFSVLEHGERLTNIRSHYSEYSFGFEDFAKLERLGLIYKITKDTEKILRISPIVSDFVKQGMSVEEKSELIKKSLNLCLGSEWMSGNVKVSSVAKMMLKNPEFYPGNVHSTISTYFILLNEDSLTREMKALIHVSVGYCLYLRDACYYKELVAFSRMVYSKISIFDINDKYRVAYFLASGLRMIDEDEQSVEFIEPLCLDYFKKDFCQKSYYFKMLENIVMACSSFDEEKSYKYATILKKTSPKSSVYYLNAESHLAEKNSPEGRIKKLITLEKKCRANGFNTLANNISIRLHHLLPSTSFKYIDEVIKTEVGIYTKARALIIKYEDILNRGAGFKIDASALRELRGVYDYLFSQRLDDLFNRCTEILWKMMKGSGDINELYFLFKRGSVIWRVTSLYEKELHYAQDLNSQQVVQIALKEDVAYLTVRLDFLALKLQE